MTDTVDITRRVTELETKEAVRRALELAAQTVEAISGTRHYQYAFKKAARKIRSLKPE